MQTALPVRPAQSQGGDEIVIDAPIERLWQLISDSKMLEKWGPPVREVGRIDAPERLGSRRNIVAEMTPRGAAITAGESATARKRKVAHFRELRIEHVEGRKIGYRIEEEDMGMFRMITEVGFTMELESLGPRRTRVVWTFFQNPKGLAGRIMNRLFIVHQQRKNRLGALDSLKRYAETHP